MGSICQSRIVCLLVFGALFFHKTLDASPTLILEPGKVSFIAGPCLEYLEDKEGTWTISDIERPEMAEKFIQYGKEVVNFGFATSTYWLKFTVKNTHPEVTSWILEIGYPHLDTFSLFFPDGKGGYREKRSGDLIPFTEREINHRLFLFKLQIPTGGSQEIFMKVKTESSLQVPITIWEPIHYSENVYREELGYGIYYGIMIVMVFYNLFLFLSIRDRATLYYVLYIGTFGFGVMSLNGVPTQFFWYQWPLFANKILLVSLFLALATMCLFSRTYLNTKIHAPRIDKAIVFLMMFGFICSVACVFIHYELGVKLVAVLGVSCPIPTFIAGIICWRKGGIAARFYLIAWILLLIGILVLALRNFGVLPSVFFTEYAVQIGSALEVILLSLGLADRINVMKRERFLAQQEALSAQEEVVQQLREMDFLKDKMNRSLEEKVIKRTEELSQAMKALETKNDQLKETTQALWGEMELAKRIQTVLLPKKPAIPGYEISAYMAPAEEVGGDYYDIIHSHGKDWIVIGDVSGHGVPAGLVMMMVQTAIHVTVGQDACLSPARLLSAINRTITGNIQMMNDDKYMSIMVMAVHEEGRLLFSGLHQDILVFRQKTRELEVVETNGIWLGLSEDIGGLLRDDLLVIHQGDMVFMFTDGVIESRERPEREDLEFHSIAMFGQERLEALLRELGGASTDQVLKRVLGELSHYETRDDVTMVAVKRI